MLLRREGGERHGRATHRHTYPNRARKARSEPSALFFPPQTLDLISVSFLHPPQQRCLSWPGCAWLWNLCFRLIKAWGWRGEGGGRKAERCTASLGTEPHPWVPKFRRCRPAAAVLRGASCGGSAGSSAWALRVCLHACLSGKSTPSSEAHVIPV